MNPIKIVPVEVSPLDNKTILFKVCTTRKFLWWEYNYDVCNHKMFNIDLATTITDKLNNELIRAKEYNKSVDSRR